MAHEKSNEKSNLDFFVRTKAVQAFSFCLLSLLLSLLTAFFSLANVIAPNFVFQSIAVMSLGFLIALIVGEVFRILWWVKKGLGNHWQYRTPPHDDFSDENQIMLFPDDIWNERNRKPISEIHIRPINPMIKMGTQSVVLALVIAVGGNFTGTFLFLIWNRSNLSVPIDFLDLFDHLIVPILGPIASVLLNSLRMLSEITSAYSVFSIVVLFILPSIFLLSGSLNFIGATEEWTFKQLQQAGEVEDGRTVVLKSLTNSVESTLRSLIRDISSRIKSLSFEQKLTPSFIVWLLFSLLWTIITGIFTVASDFSEAPASLLFGIVLTAYVIYMWASDEHDEFNESE